MNKRLSEKEARIIGCLIEKKITTPEYYPLSLNSLTTACNQKSNREPVVNYSEFEVEEVISELIEKGFITEVFGNGRVVKYRERFSSEMNFKSAEVAVITGLFLRGAQTAGEIRSRSARLHQFENIGTVQETLNKMMSDENGPFVVKLEKESGRKENRYYHLFYGEEILESFKSTEVPMVKENEESLREEINELKRELADLKKEFENFKNQF